MFTNMVIQLELDGSGLMLSRIIQGGGDWVGLHFAWLVSVQKSHYDLSKLNRLAPDAAVLMWNGSPSNTSFHVGSWTLMSIVQLSAISKSLISRAKK